MKTVSNSLSGLTRTLMVCLGLLALMSQSARAQAAVDLFEQAIYTEETRGDVNAAAILYQRILDDPSADRVIAAQAQLRLGLCQLKLGENPRAITALETLSARFPDRVNLIEALDKRMPRLLDEMIRQIEKNYVLEVDRSELIDTALRAIVGKLEPGTGGMRSNDMAVLAMDEVVEAKLNIEQTLGGIGAMLRIDSKSGDVIIQDFLLNSPAARGGLRKSDIIREINGTNISRFKLKDVVDMLRGPAESAVKVGVHRGGASDLLPFDLVRESIRIPSVHGVRVNPDGTPDFWVDARAGIGFMRINYFGHHTPAEVAAALATLTQQGLKALVLDLRNCPGGSLTDAVAVADLFVATGKIVTVKGRNSEDVYSATVEGTYSDFPMIVLANSVTASAAEIVAACLQDHQRAIVVGERTFGQGVVRSLIRLEESGSALRLPVGVFYRPNGRNMNRYSTSTDSDDWGVRPDPGFEVEWSQPKNTLTTDPVPNARADDVVDPQLDKGLGWIHRRLGLKQ